MKPTSPSNSGGGESRDIFNADYTGLPGHHRVAQPPGGYCQDLWGGTCNGTPRHHRISQPPGGYCQDLWGSTYTGIPRHHRVLKPPGGGSSDIFGVDASEPARVRNTNHLQSSMFGNMMETATPKNGNPVTGEGYAIANGVKEMAAAVPASPVKVATTNGTGAAPKTNGTANIASEPAQLARERVPLGRVPPGGFSSGLW